MTLTSNATTMKLPAIDETSRASTRLGGMVGYWLEEAGEKIASKPKFRRMEFTPDKVIVLCYATDELLQDSGMLEAIIRQGFAEEITFQVEQAIVSGSGVGRPLGLLNSPSLITTSAEGGQAADTFIFENAVKMWMRLHPSCRKDAVWLISPDLEGEVWQFSLAIGTGGSSVYMASAADSPYSTLFGRPIIPTELCSAKGDLGDVILFSPSQYLVVDKGTTQVDMSLSVRFIYDESVFRGVYRVSGQSLWHSAITPANSSDSQSNIVTLEAR
jgi:HK97 family phage major capsid protein